MNNVVRRPICPTFIHDDGTKIIVCAVGLFICIYIFYKIVRYYST